MSHDPQREVDWQFLIGYPWPEAREVLNEEAVEYKMLLTKAPHKQAASQDLRVIALREEEPLVVICAAPDWTVAKEVGHG